MNFWKNNGIRISFLLIILIFYFFMMKKQSNEFNINDYSYLNDNCSSNCKTLDIDIMKCLDACSINNIKSINYQPMIILIIAILLFLIYLVFRIRLYQFFDYLEDRLYLNKKFIKLRNEDYDDEDDSKLYYKITDI